ncbi:glycoside hydrolase family 28 protein [Pedobacter sp. MC2016-14]|uniref:glycoside hydrolase family 28 protein n=1 Tax=Pedobacter sp. MC2016-14 TaxID=2897327 RepID=UPI001E4A1974|nr:glycoside hydrolase family 28 protein [Pedobacter sp. MC2016-14]MCD0488818.1 glycoside hydrolase family 28 protein [Pedobacter sp. MC2016-14]
MIKKLLFLMILFSGISFPIAKAGSPYYNVRDFGVVADGKTVTTAAIQAVIEKCAKAGGGKIVFPAGNYLTGPLFMRSNIEIEILAGATLIFHDDILNTPVIEGSWEGIERKVYAALFTGHNLKNIAITGRGRLEGRGSTWWKAYRETEAIRIRLGITEREPDNPKDSPLPFPRPKMINFYNCEDILISGITINNSTSWTIHPVFCRNIEINGISIVQPYDSPNTDGINPEACHNVRIFNCFIDCGDDCITLKSGYNEHGRKKGIPCENIVIANCTFAHGRSAVGIGSEMSGGVRNVTISNCVFKGTRRGLRIKSKRDRGGVVENILATGIIMEDIEEAISIDMYYETKSDAAEPISEKTPLFRNIRFSNIIGSNIDQPINVWGLPESPIEGLVLENIRMESKKGMDAKFVKDLRLHNVEIINEDGKVPFYIRNGYKVEVSLLRGPVGKAKNNIETEKVTEFKDLFRNITN